MGDKYGVLLGLEGKQLVVAFGLRLIINSKGLSNLHKMIRHILDRLRRDRQQNRNHRMSHSESE